MKPKSVFMPNEKQPTSPVNKMGLDELRIKVAELCGWKKEQIEAWKVVRDLKKEQSKLPRPRDSFSGWSMIDKIEAAESSEQYYGDPPDFPSDLNACVEFEKGLTNKDLCVRYILNLDAVCGDESIISATAEQRCRAFIQCHS